MSRILRRMLTVSSVAFLHAGYTAIRQAIHSVKNPSTDRSSSPQQTSVDYSWRLILILNGLTVVGVSYLIVRHLPAAAARPPAIARSHAALQLVSSIHNMPTSDSQLIDANTRFGFQLLTQLIQPEEMQNLTISPTSIAIALSMLYNGAAGETQQAMANALSLQGLSLRELNQANAALMTTLEIADPQVQLQIANSLWGRSGFTFKPEFLQQNRSFYSAEITSLDFANPNASAQINQWVNQNTNGKIDQIIDQIDPQQVLFLINAVYFKGDWATQFDPAKTTNQPFHLLDGSQKNQPMMSQQGSYSYYETDQFQAVSLPYGNRRFSMDIFLPQPESSLTQFYQTLTPENWQSWLNHFSEREGSIQIPKFTTTYETSLNQALTALGMGVAFSDRADFTQLSQTTTAIDQVKHKTFIEVNETGTEAAAVTSVGVRVTSMPLDPPFQFMADRPFFYAIRDRQTGAVVFMGTIVAPE